MKTVQTIDQMQQFVVVAKKEGKTIGFVPTMGYLHEGHLSLVRVSKKECDITIVSIFVNPTQFCEGEDLDTYPRDIERDTQRAEEAGADVIFAPSVEEMYPKGYVTYVDTDSSLTDKLCGKSRPGHFRGVTTVVAKLFGIVDPDRSYFGQKDMQQAVIVKKMVEDLNFRTKINVMPIVREEDGLAMSSRNTYLSDEDRKQAVNIYKSLLRAKKMIKEEESSAVVIKKEITSILNEDNNTRIDYVEICDMQSLDEVDVVEKGTVIVIAAFVGKTRLIDNVVIN